MKNQLIASIAAGLLVMCTVSADDALPPEQIRAGEARQTQIKAQTQNVAAQLGAIIDEFKRNGLDGQDVEVLEAIRRVLGKLSDQEMKKVIDALQEARSQADPSQSKKAFAGAVSDQKAIIAQLRALLIEYQRQQALYELSLRLAALAERENANLKTVVDLAKMTGNATASRFDDTQRASLQIQAADQQGLKDEVNPLLTKLETLTKDADGTTKDRLNKALEQVKTGGIKPAMDAAIEDLKNAALYRAAGSEKIIRDQLRELSRLVAPPKDTLAALAAAMKEIEKQIEAEKAIVEQTRKMDKKNDAAELENRQADVVDRTDAVRNDLAQIAPDASGELKNAQNQMQEARANLSEQRRTDALKNEAMALEKLEAAKKALQEQIARTEPQQKPEDKLAATKQLQERTKEMIKKEEEIKSATAANQNKDKELKALAPKQADLEEQTRDLSRDAAAQAPEAAQSIGDAAQQMDKSEKNLAKPQQQAKPAQEAQAAAISALKQAEEQLAKQAEQLEKAKQELADLMDSRAKIIKLIEGQQSVQLNTAKLAAKTDGKSDPKAPKDKNKVEVNYMAAEEAGVKASPTASPAPSTPKELSPPQDDLAKRTDQVKTELQETEKAASQPLDDAKKNMIDARGKLDANDARRASPAQLEALVNLYKAKDALDKKIQDLQKQLGQEPQNADANAAAQKIEQLQKDVARANEQLNADPQQMQKSLQQQQKEIADALQQMQKDQQADSPQKQPLDQAQQAAQQAAQQLAQNNNNEALKSMQKAQQGIAEAMKGQPQPPPAQKGQPQQGQPEKGQPEKGQPEQGQPQEGQPEQGQPAQADAAQGQPAQGQPGQGQPGQGQPGQGKPAQGQPGHGLPQLAQKQSDLQKQLEQMMQGDPTQQAAAGLEQAAGEAAQMASGQQGQLPPGANQAMQQAAAALAQAAAAAGGQDKQTAQEKAADAQAALAQAAASLSLAQAGLNGQMASNQGQPGQGQPGQGQPGQGQPGKGQQQGQGQGQDQKGTGQNNPNRSTGDRNSIKGGSFSAALPGKDGKGNGQYQALPQRDRNAITQSRNEKYPEEYGPQVEQYLKNLADQEDAGK